MMTEDLPGFEQLVCPECGHYVVPLANANTGYLRSAFGCSSIICGWRGNYPKKIKVSYLAGPDKEEQEASND